MTAATIRPLIGVTACLKERDDFVFHSVGEKYVDAVIQGTDGIPVIIPAIAARQRIDELLDRLDGVMLTGSPSNVDPAHYGGPPAREGNLADPARDGTTLPLIRRAVDLGVPLFAICRGIQELNVALGGTLHQHVHEVPGRRDHRSDKSRPPQERYDPTHPIGVSPGGKLQQILGGRDRHRGQLPARAGHRPAGSPARRRGPGRGWHDRGGHGQGRAGLRDRRPMAPRMAGRREPLVAPPLRRVRRRGPGAGGSEAAVWKRFKSGLGRTGSPRSNASSPTSMAWRVARFSPATSSSARSTRMCSACRRVSSSRR